MKRMFYPTIKNLEKEGFKKLRFGKKVELRDLAERGKKAGRYTNYRIMPKYEKGARKRGYYLYVKR